MNPAPPVTRDVLGHQGAKCVSSRTSTMFPAKPSTASGGDRSQRGPSATAQKIGNANRLWRPKLWIVPERSSSADDDGRVRGPGPVARAELPEQHEQRQHERGAGAVDEPFEAPRRGQQHGHRAHVGRDRGRPRAEAPPRQRQPEDRCRGQQADQQAVPLEEAAELVGPVREVARPAAAPEPLRVEEHASLDRCAPRSTPRHPRPPPPAAPHRASRGGPCHGRARRAAARSGRRWAGRGRRPRRAHRPPAVSREARRRLPRRPPPARAHPGRRAPARTSPASRRARARSAAASAATRSRRRRMLRGTPPTRARRRPRSPSASRPSAATAARAGRRRTAGRPCPAG